MLLENKVGLIIGVANEHSIAAGCARAAAEEGASLALTCLNEKAAAYAQPVADTVNAAALIKLDVADDDQLEAAFEIVRKLWGRLDFLIHSIAYCPKEDLHARVIDCTRGGFAEAMDISCHSFIRTARLAAPLMEKGGSLMTITYHGAEEVVDQYNIMGPVKAALEASVRYLAHNLGEQGVRVNGLSPGPIATRAALGIDHFDALMDEAAARAPVPRLVSIEDVGLFAAFLASDNAAAITGGIHYIDNGFNIMA